MTPTPQEMAETGMWLARSRWRHVRLSWAGKLWTVEFWEGRRRVNVNQATDLRNALANPPREEDEG